MIVIQILLCAGFAAVGRWVQLHQEKVFPKGHFVAVNSWGAKLGRAQVVLVGSFAVFAGTTGTLLALFSIIPSESKAVTIIGLAVAASTGMLALFYVRREVKSLPPPQSTHPHGWWPS